MDVAILLDLSGFAHFCFCFAARNVKRTFPSKGLSKSVDRLKSLEKYCSSLLQCESTVSHSAEVIRFFLPNEQELQPEFTQNR